MATGPAREYDNALRLLSCPSFGTDVLSSAELVQFFEARLGEAGVASHRTTGTKMQRIKDEAFQLIINSISFKLRISEQSPSLFSSSPPNILVMSGGTLLL